MYQRHDHPSCPPLVTIDTPDGTKRIRPEHTCKGRWVVQLIVNADTGKRRVIYAKTKKDALRELGAEKRRLEDNGEIPTATITVKRWLEYWLDNIVSLRVDPLTLGTYRSAVTQYLIPSIGRHRLDKLSPPHIRAMHQYVLTRTRTVGTGDDRREVPLSISTAKSAHRVLNVALVDAIKEGRIVRNVLERVDSPRGTSKPRGILTAEQGRILLRAVSGDRLGARWAVALLEGIRQGEALGLEWARTDLDRGLMDISWQLKPLGYRHGCGGTCGRKRNADCPRRELDVRRDYEHRNLHGRLTLTRPKSLRSKRLMPIPAPLVAALRARRDLYEAERAGYVADHGLVFCELDGRPIDRHDDYQAWKALLRRLDLPDIPLHSARHTTVTLLRQAGVPADVVRDIAGHAGLETQEAYRHEDTTRQRAALESLSELLSIEEIEPS